MNLYDETLKHNCRSPKVEPLIERDIAIVEAHEHMSKYSPIHRIRETVGDHGFRLSSWCSTRCCHLRSYERDKFVFSEWVYWNSTAVLSVEDTG
jgi:hypothetical protein